MPLAPRHPQGEGLDTPCAVTVGGGGIRRVLGGDERRGGGKERGELENVEEGEAEDDVERGGEHLCGFGFRV